MNIRSLLSWRYWADRALDTYWLSYPQGNLEPVTYTWPLDRGLLADVTIHWPQAYQWPPLRHWGESLRSALGRFVEIRTVDIPQPYDGVIRFAVICRGQTYHVNVEVSDYLDLNEEAYAATDLHFKMQYRVGGYGNRDRLLPGGYINNLPTIYRFLPRLRSMRDSSQPLYDVHGRFGLLMDQRRPALDILRNSAGFRFVGLDGKVRYGTFLREVAQAKICIDLPSYSPITFRLIDYFAIGSCVIGPPHDSRLHIPFQDRIHLAYCKPDYSDLEALCVYYLTHEEERVALVQNSRRFFDSYVHRSQLATYYLTHCLRLLT